MTHQIGDQVVCKDWQGLNVLATVVEVYDGGWAKAIARKQYGFGINAYVETLEFPVIPKTDHLPERIPGSNQLRFA